MTENECRSKFRDMLGALAPTQRNNFLAWVQEFAANQERCCDVSAPFRRDKGDVLLACIQSAIREKIPFRAVMESERILFPVVGDDANLNEKNCVHVDAFLYDCDAVDDLIEEGKLSNAYCVDCGSTNTKSITFITHSTSIERLQFMFKSALPSLDGKILVDVGSRLGAVLYGAFVYSEAKEIIGIEMNGDWCRLQSEVVQKFKMDKRITVLHGDMLTMSDVIKRADVVVLNNVFEWFVSLKEQEKLWKYLRETITQDTIVVASPSIEKSFSLIDTDIDLSAWLKDIPVATYAKEFIEENDLKFYTVL